jgi:hypothetical protein
MQKFYIPIGAASLQPPAGDYQECYDASDVDERIARLERGYKALAEVAQETNDHCLKLEKALRRCHEVLSGHAMNKQELINALEAIESCGLIERS